jgi:hypothetical protein
LLYVKAPTGSVHDARLGAGPKDHFGSKTAVPARK